MHTSGLLLLLCSGIFVYLVWRLIATRKDKPSHHTVAILVLGDIGRSPRMMYHAESFAQNGFMTYLVGYGGSRPVPSLLEAPHVRLLYLPEIPKLLTKLPFLLLAPLKVLLQIVSIFVALSLSIPHPPEFLMVQNPPSIPTLAVAWAVCSFRGSKLIIDWHNLGFSILALRLGPSHPLVNLAKKFEAFFGRNAYLHLFVTQALQDHLVKEWHLQGAKAVLHDRPPAHFHPASAFESHELLLQLNSSFSTPSLASFLPPFAFPHSTFRTQVSTELPSLRPDRPVLLVSSTSWTPDEDFGILLEALRLYEKHAKTTFASDQHHAFPKLMVVVTGKGPLKEKYMKDVITLEKEEAWEYIRCRSIWLEAQDYPVLLGSADLGVCLHASSSALDLPMKIVDMFGCGLPVCALDFSCLPELVKEGQNGLIFKTAAQLAEQLTFLLAGFPAAPELRRLRASLIRTSDTRQTHSHPSLQEWEWGTWAENWNSVLRPLILR